MSNRNRITTHHHHLESRPGPLRRRVQGEAHDDFQREREVRESVSGTLTLDDVEPEQTRRSRPRSMSPRLRPATRSATRT